MSSPPAALSSRLVLQALNIAAEHGVPVEALCREVGLHRADLDDPEARIPYDVLDTVLERAVEVTGDDNLGLHMARMSYVDPDDAASLVILTSATLKESMVRGCRYQRVWGDGERFKVEETVRGVRMRFTPVGPWRPAHRHMVEVAMVQLATGTRFFTGVDVRPLQVRFVHPAPADILEHEDLFGCPLVFGAPHSDIEFSHEDAERPFVHADALLSSMFEKKAQRALARLPTTASLSERVREQVRRTLAGGDFSFEAVARALHMPQRTLQRKLAEEGQSYAGILEAVRRELSEDYLRRRMSIAEVSFLLGYGEPTTFHRAFKRWWGMSPEAFRRAHTPSPSGRGPG
ncbi:helix-turn-helix domain-containing protein [Archangium minus]|uniref:Helix-turn-helix domain-containing protein n=1 Tax=Archangium minus TaxID=83450 RepID=A0ABY9X7Z1_9BACT|nr:helix-turn-helix domain-containing protein [Archangium minus]